MKKISFIVFILSHFLFGFAENVNINNKHFNGAITEHIVNDYMRSNGARIIDTEIGRNGIDGLFYKKVNGKMQVFVIESKYNTSQLSETKKHGLQMSKKWKIGKIDEKISQLQKILKTAPSNEAKKIQKEINLLKEVRKLVLAGKDKSFLFHLQPLGDKKYQLKLYELDKNGKKIGEAKRYGINNKTIDLNKKYPPNTKEYKLQKLISHSIRKEKKLVTEKEKLNEYKNKLKSLPKDSSEYQNILEKIKKQEEIIAKINKSLPKAKYLRKCSTYTTAKSLGIKTGVKVFGVMAADIGATFIKKLPIIGTIVQAITDGYMMYEIEQNRETINQNRKQITQNTKTIKLNSQYLIRLIQEQEILKQNISYNSYKIDQIVSHLVSVDNNIQSLQTDIQSMTYRIDTLNNLIQKNAKEIKEIKNGIFKTGIKQLSFYYDTNDAKYLANAINDFEMAKNIKNIKIIGLIDYYLIISHYENYLITKNKKELETIEDEFSKLKDVAVKNDKKISLLINAYSAITDNNYLKEKYKNILDDIVKKRIYLLSKDRKFDNAVYFAIQFGDKKLIKYANSKREKNYQKYKNFNSIQNVNKVLNKNQNALLNKEAVRFLYKKDAYLKALEILRNKRIDDEDFVLKAYLLIYKQLGYKKEMKKLTQLILENNTYSLKIKKYVKNLLKNS